MNADQIKTEVDKNLAKLETLRDEVNLKLHLASLDLKQEWEDKLAPRVLEVQDSAKSIGDASRNALTEVVGKVEEFVARFRGPSADAKPATDADKATR